jgi:hypothetical protein
MEKALGVGFCIDLRRVMKNKLLRCNKIEWQAPWDFLIQKKIAILYSNLSYFLEGV